MSKPFKPMLAHVYDSDKIDPKGWYISEKVDGIRAIWTGTELLTRNHKKIIAPDWWLKHLPTIALDGELCLGKGTFQQTCSIVKTKSGEDKGWKKCSYCEENSIPGADTHKFADCPHRPTCEFCGKKSHGGRNVPLTREYCPKVKPCGKCGSKAHDTSNHVDVPIITPIPEPGPTPIPSPNPDPRPSTNLAKRPPEGHF